ncbi:hypothetical protein FCOIX_955 [Fusarium coicis]|nr:hypothetical protein FCOIX_955 [Fusarium coicis]
MVFRRANMPPLVGQFWYPMLFGYMQENPDTFVPGLPWSLQHSKRFYISSDSQDPFLLAQHRCNTEQPASKFSSHELPQVFSSGRTGRQVRAVASLLFSLPPPTFSLLSFFFNFIIVNISAPHPKTTAAEAATMNNQARGNNCKCRFRRGRGQYPRGTMGHAQNGGVPGQAPVPFPPPPPPPSVVAYPAAKAVTRLKS